MGISPDGGFRIADYPWFTEIDVDEASRDFVHVDNIRIAALFNEARARFQSLLVGCPDGKGFAEQVIARIALDFVAELVWRPVVGVAGRVERIGRTSYAVEMLLESMGTVFARCVTIYVWVEGGQPRPLSPDARMTLGRLSLPSSG